jgi:hypothetical protein
LLAGAKAEEELITAVRTSAAVASFIVEVNEWFEVRFGIESVISTYG